MFACSKICLTGHDDAIMRQKIKKAPIARSLLNLILAATYVPAQLPAQYHRLSKA